MDICLLTQVDALPAQDFTAAKDMRIGKLLSGCFQASAHLPTFAGLPALQHLCLYAIPSTAFSPLFSGTC